MRVREPEATHHQRGIRGSDAGFADGDLVLAVNTSTGDCTLMLFTQVQSAAFKLQRNPGGTTTYNSTASFQNTNGWPAYAAGVSIFKLGQLISHAYPVNSSHQLTLTDNISLTESPTFILTKRKVVSLVRTSDAQALEQNVPGHRTSPKRKS